MMHDLTSKLLASRHVVGDRVILDWLEIVRMSQPITFGCRGRGVRVEWLREAWDCSQSMVSRRLAAINAAPPEVGLGRLERVRFTRGWWRVVERRYQPDLLSHRHDS